MKKFIICFSIFLICVLSSILYVFSLTNGYSDPYYLKLIPPRQGSMILGTSKAAQGIQPDVLEGKLNVKFFNYAFVIFASPYGSTYLESIKAKLDTTNKDNIFILTLDVWSLCSLTEDPDDTLNFREMKSFLHGVKNVNQSPNFKYLIHYFDGNYYKILFKNRTAFLHHNGWLEVNLDNDTGKIKNRTAFTINDYKKKMHLYKYSAVRYAYLLKTIDYLKEYGRVYLVRLPVHPDLYTIETTLLPDFDSTIQSAIEKSEGYFDMKSFNSDCNYTDGVHLNKENGRKISATIADWISELECGTNAQHYVVPNCGIGTEQ